MSEESHSRNVFTTHSDISPLVIEIGTAVTSMCVFTCASSAEIINYAGQYFGKKYTSVRTSSPNDALQACTCNYFWKLTKLVDQAPLFSDDEPFCEGQPFVSTYVGAVTVLIGGWIRSDNIKGSSKLCLYM